MFYGFKLGIDETMDGLQHIGAVGVVHVIVHLFAALLTTEQARFAQNLKVMGNRRAAELEQPTDFIDADFLVLLEDQQNLLAGRITESGEELSESCPLFR